MSKNDLSLKLSVKMPKYRIKVFAMVVALLILGNRWGVVSDAVGSRASNAMMEWVKRGLKTHVV